MCELVLKTNEPSPNVGVVPQKLVTRRVAVRGVERRELVEVEWRDAERGVGTTGAPSFSLEGLLNRSAVEKLGERIDTGFRLDLAHPALRRSVLSPAPSGATQSPRIKADKTFDLHVIEVVPACSTTAKTGREMSGC